MHTRGPVNMNLFRRINPIQYRIFVINLLATIFVTRFVKQLARLCIFSSVFNRAILFALQLCEIITYEDTPHIRIKREFI